jgi:hypothetical protein
MKRLEILTAAALLAGCGEPSTPPTPTPMPAAAQACQMEVVTHLVPVAPAADPFAVQYTEVAAKDGVAYLGAEDGAGVFVLDVASGQTLGVLDPGLGSRMNSVAAAGDLLAFAPGFDGVLVYDISNPRAPARRAQQDTLPYCHTVFVHADVVYCATSSPWGAHVGLYRVSRPADPETPLQVAPAGNYSLPIPRDQPGSFESMVHDLYVHERGGRTLAYLAYWERGLVIVDVTDPAAPQLVGATEPMPGHWIHSVWVEGDFAYVGEENYKGLLRVFDVSDPTAPREVGQLHSTEGDASSVHNIHVANGFVYAAWYQDGLRAFPTWTGPGTTEVAWFHTWNGADNRDNPARHEARFTGNWDVFVERDLIYAADMQTGLWVLRHRPATPGCGPDQPRGTSAYAKTGRPPFGWGLVRPRAVRSGRTFELSATIESVDPDFIATDEMVRPLNPHIGLRGIEPREPSQIDEMLPNERRSWRRLSATVDLPAGAIPDGLWLEAQIDDDGTRRTVGHKVEILDMPPVNEDVEPNQDNYVSGVLQTDASGQVRIAGTLDQSDYQDVYRYEIPAAASGLQIRVRSPQGGRFQRYSTTVDVWGLGPAGRPHPPVQQVIWDPQEAGSQLEQVVTVPAGTSGTLGISVWTFIRADPRDMPVTLPYTIELAPL